MRRRQYLAAVGATVASATSAANSVVGATCVETRQTTNNRASLTNDRLAAELRSLDKRSSLVALRRIGRSAGRDDPLWELRIGEGGTNVHIVTQLHGDEPAGTEAVLAVVRELVDDPEANAGILDGLTLTIVPRANPDGAMYARDDDGDGDSERLTRRENVQPWRQRDSRHEPDYHTGDRAPGYDLNRDFDPTAGVTGAGRSSRNRASGGWTQYEEDGKRRWRHDRTYREYPSAGAVSASRRKSPPSSTPTDMRAPTWR
ncbi:M14 family zinc carboxypeptidase [Haloprofundus salilacus]|uniref:M14 family zinc carboxypeptidase n=1 Tax=Haloprofundus salilacus TaxID=2876190 RepID=UPI001CCF3DDB|nr:M14 family zinc carboxypeptidase [Haloprofundus salilacus]